MPGLGKFEAPHAAVDHIFMHPECDLIEKRFTTSCACHAVLTGSISGSSFAMNKMGFQPTCGCEFAFASLILSPVRFMYLVHVIVQFGDRADPQTAEYACHVPPGARLLVDFALSLVEKHTAAL